MNKPHRIAAGGITFKNNQVLLVRYHDNNDGTYLACPGGGLEDDENIVQAIVRETMEETNVKVKPKRVVIIEDLICFAYKMSKTWMICDFIEGNIIQTDEAKHEGIIEAAWFSRPELVDEVVYPQPLLQVEWDQLRSENWQVMCLPTRTATF